MGNRVFTQTEYSGSVASFTGTEDSSITSLIANIAPIQDLHGYDHPWPAGGGKNKFDPSVYSAYLQSSGKYRAKASQITIILIPIPSALLNTACTFSFYADMTNVGDLTSVSAQAVVGGKNKNGNLVRNGSIGRSTVTFTPTSESDYIHITFGSNGYNEFTFYDIQLEASGSVTDFAPYSNICPISGRTGLSVYVSPTQDVADATTYAVDWTSEAGTVYGGTVDVVTGVLTVDRASVDLGTLNWRMIGSTNKYFQSDALIGSIKPPVNSSTLANAICEEYKCVTWSDPTYESGRFAVNGDPTPSRGKISFTNTNYASAADFKTAMSGIKLVYELATPLTYQLTPQEVAVLVGQNNVWSNAGGSVDVIVSSPLQGFHGWLIKVKQGNNLVEIPLTFIRAETYTVTPDQRLEWSAERDVTGVLHRETTENTPPKIEFETPLMTNTDIQALNTIIQNGFTNTLGRDVTIQFYNPEKNEYWQWDCYMPDVHYNIRNVDTAHNVINYEQLRYAFIGY